MDGVEVGGVEVGGKGMDVAGGGGAGRDFC